MKTRSKTQIEESMIYEERSISLQPHALADFTSSFDQTIRPMVEAYGGETLCTLSAAIGDPDEEVLQITRYPDFGSWEAAQAERPSLLKELTRTESVRLLKPIASRPKNEIPPEDLRPFYGHRRFFIDPSDLNEFVRHSENGIWPRIEAQGACILGLWTTVAATSPLEIVLLTGYEGPAHWEETRATNDESPEGIDPEIWVRSRRLRDARRLLTTKTWVRLMRRVGS